MSPKKRTVRKEPKPQHKASKSNCPVPPIGEGVLPSTPLIEGQPISLSGTENSSLPANKGGKGGKSTQSASDSGRTPTGSASQTAETRTSASSNAPSSSSRTGGSFTPRMFQEAFAMPTQPPAPWDLPGSQVYISGRELDTVREFCASQGMEEELCIRTDPNGAKRTDVTFLEGAKMFVSLQGEERAAFSETIKAAVSQSCVDVARFYVSEPGTARFIDVTPDYSGGVSEPRTARKQGATPENRKKKEGGGTSQNPKEEREAVSEDPTEKERQKWFTDQRKMMKKLETTMLILHNILEKQEKSEEETQS